VSDEPWRLHKVAARLKALGLEEFVVIGRDAETDFVFVASEELPFSTLLGLLETGKVHAIQCAIEQRKIGPALEGEDSE
jgi:hypothetical protein